MDEKFISSMVLAGFLLQSGWKSSGQAVVDEQTEGKAGKKQVDGIDQQEEDRIVYLLDRNRSSEELARVRGNNPGELRTEKLGLLWLQSYTN